MSRSGLSLWIVACGVSIASLIVLAPSHGQEAPSTQPAARSRAPMEFETYQVILLRAGENAESIPREQLQDIGRKHLEHLRKMGESGKMVIAGPFGDQQDKTFRGMCVYRVGSVDEARKLAEEDPAVRAGRLKVDAMTWYVEKGYMTFPKAPATQPQE